jgi:hypothetical protein
MIGLFETQADLIGDFLFEMMAEFVGGSLDTSGGSPSAEPLGLRVSREDAAPL